MPFETRYARPADDEVEALVHAALRGAAPPRDTWDIIETGSSNLVVLTGSAAVRIARGGGGTDLRRVQELIDHLPGLPFDLPQSLGPIVEHHGLVAVATRRLRGDVHPPGGGNVRALRHLLDAIHGVDPAPLRTWLAPPRSFAGGAKWREVMDESVIPRLPAEVQDEARRRVDALQGLPRVRCTLNHGDLAGSNILWQEGRVTGVLDWDLTAEDDPAEDVASLAGWHGWDIVHELADAETVAHATVFRASFPLQIVAFTVVQERPDDEIDRAVLRAAGALQR